MAHGEDFNMKWFQRVKIIAIAGGWLALVGMTIVNTSQLEGNGKYAMVLPIILTVFLLAYIQQIIKKYGWSRFWRRIW